METDRIYIVAKEASKLIWENPKWFQVFRLLNNIKYNLRWLFRGLWESKGSEQPKDTIKDIIYLGIKLLTIACPKSRHKYKFKDDRNWWERLATMIGSYFCFGSETEEEFQESFNNYFIIL